MCESNCIKVSKRSAANCQIQCNGRATCMQCDGTSENRAMIFVFGVYTMWTRNMYANIDCFRLLEIKTNSIQCSFWKRITNWIAQEHAVICIKIHFSCIIFQKICFFAGEAGLSLNKCVWVRVCMSIWQPNAIN